MSVTMTAAAAACHGARWQVQGLVLEILDVDGVWDQAFGTLATSIPMTPADDVGPDPALTLELRKGPAALPETSCYTHESQGFGCSILEDAARTLVHDGFSWFRIDTRRMHGELCLHPRSLAVGPKTGFDLFLIGLNEMLAELGFFDLHAGALASDAADLLLVGGSCTGKSTTAVALACAGWQYLSDDAVLLKASDPVTAHGFRDVFSVDPGLARHFPELEQSIGAQMDTETGKCQLTMREALPKQYADTCTPTHLIFTAVDSRSETRLAPLEPGEALSRLVSQSPSLAFRRRRAAAQLETLARLTTQSHSFALSAGPDARQDPRLLARLITEVCPTASDSYPRGTR